MLCGFCKALPSHACSQEVILTWGTLQQPRSLQQCLAAEQTNVTKSTEEGWWQSEHTLTSCFIRHLPSSVSSALAGGVTSVAIASSSAEQRQHCECGLPRTEGDMGRLQELSWEPGDSTQNQCPGTAYPEHLFKQKAPTLCRAGRARSWLPSALGKLCTSPSSPQPISQNLKNQLLQHATCEPYSTLVFRLDWVFLWPPDTLSRTELKASYQTYTTHTELPTSAQPPPQEPGKVLVYTKGRKSKGTHLLTISIYSSSSVLFNAFLRNTANSCKNSCRSEEQKREDATAEHAEIILQTDGLTAASSSPSSYRESEESESQYKSPILHYLEGSNTPPMALSHNGTCCTVAASNY